MTTELDRIATKNVKQKIDTAHKKLNIKQHNLKAAQKATKADTPHEDRSLLEKMIGTKRHFSLHKERKKTKQTRKFLKEQEDRLDKHGAWSKDNKKGSAFAGREKEKLIEKGFPSKAKMAGGGVALRGFGRAFRKGGKV